MNKDKLLKVARLAVDGELGEREAARLILEREGTTADKVLEDLSIVTVEFTFKTKQEQRIIFQNFYRLTNSSDVYYCPVNPRKSAVQIRADLADEFIRTNKTLVSLWRKQLENLLTAFITRHELHSDTPVSDGQKLTDDEIAEIMGMAANIRQATLGKGLLNG